MELSDATTPGAAPADPAPTAGPTPNATPDPAPNPTATAPPGPDADPAPTGAFADDPHIGRIIVSEDALRRRVAELGDAITADYEGRPPLLVGVLKGASFFLSDLARSIRLPIEMDFMAVSSYGSSTQSSGVVRIVKDLDADLTDRHVLIVEDIVDSGLTLAYLRRNLQARHPASLEVVALLVKDGLQEGDMDLAYEGFSIPPEFVIGYGLDAAERYRNLPYVAAYVDLEAPDPASTLGRS